MGLDYLGPITIKSEDQQILKKCWIALITCLTTRAVHLEIIRGLSTMEFLNAFRRFISSKGTPSTIISDNATQFGLAAKTISEIWNNLNSDPTITKYFSTEKIQWKFITPYSPWSGGIYERLNLEIKKAFKRTVGRKLLNMEEIVTLIKEIEAVLNSRPITYIYEDIDSPTILRPIDIIMPNQRI